MAALPYDLPYERLEHRLDFLISRAKAHVSDVSEWEFGEKEILPRACAATLFRDAACVALLLDRPREARGWLHISGKHFLLLGLPVGASLIALAAMRDAEGEFGAHTDLIEGVRRQWHASESRERERLHRPMADQARSEPRQLLAMMQADWMRDERRGIRDYNVQDEPLRMALKRNGGHPVGATGLSIDSYAEVAQWFSEHHGLDQVMPGRIAAAMTTMMAARAEHLHAASRDRFHWKMLPRPTEVVDLDATILMYLAMSNDGSPKMDTESLLDRRRDDTPLLNAPVQAAMALRRDQSLDLGL